MDSRLASITRKITCNMASFKNHYFINKGKSALILFRKCEMPFES